jgi:hypothetical protein
VRDEQNDFEDMRHFLSSIIPDKVETDILCRVLKEIWVMNVEELNKNTNEPEELKESE